MQVSLLNVSLLIPPSTVPRRTPACVAAPRRLSEHDSLAETPGHKPNPRCIVAVRYVSFQAYSLCGLRKEVEVVRVDFGLGLREGLREKFRIK